MGLSFYCGLERKTRALLIAASNISLLNLERADYIQISGVFPKLESKL
jgi:hypothetical protein